MRATPTAPTAPTTPSCTSSCTLSECRYEDLIEPAAPAASGDQLADPQELMLYPAAPPDPAGDPAGNLAGIPARLLQLTRSVVGAASPAEATGTERQEAHEIPYIVHRNRAGNLIVFRGNQRLTINKCIYDPDGYAAPQHVAQVILLDLLQRQEALPDRRHRLTKEERQQIAQEAWRLRWELALDYLDQRQHPESPIVLYPSELLSWYTARLLKSQSRTLPP